MDEIKNYLNEDKINSFYALYDKEVEKANIPESINNKNNNETNDAKQDNENKNCIQKTDESSPTQEKETEAPAVSEEGSPPDGPWRPCAPHRQRLLPAADRPG
jgi:hypothetical protein